MNQTIPISEIELVGYATVLQFLDQDEKIERLLRIYNYTCKKDLTLEMVKEADEKKSHMVAICANHDAKDPINDVTLRNQDKFLSLMKYSFFDPLAHTSQLEAVLEYLMESYMRMVWFKSQPAIKAYILRTFAESCKSHRI